MIALSQMKILFKKMYQFNYKKYNFQNSTGAASCEEFTFHKLLKLDIYFVLKHLSWMKNVKVRKFKF